MISYRPFARARESSNLITFRRLIPILLLAALGPLPVHADRADDIAALNESWRAYQAAIESGDVSEIIETARVAVNAGRKAFEARDERLPLLLTNYGKALISGAQPNAARGVLKEALDLSEEIHGKEAVQLVDILEPLGDSVADVDSASTQFKYYRRALKIIERHLGHESIEFATASLRAANKTYELSRVTTGMKHLRDAREVYSALLGEGSPEVGLVDYSLAKFEFSKGRPEAAMGHALAAVPKLEGNDPWILDFQLATRALLVQAYEEQNMTEAATPHCIAIGRLSKQRPDQDYQPLFRMVPQYPAKLLMSGVEGSVDFEFTIDEYGFVRNPQVIAESQEGRVSPTGRAYDFDESDLSFKAAALDAVKRFRYAPKFVDGVATPVENAKTRITFRIND